MQELGKRFTVLAPDTPGYGSSDPLRLETPEIPDYADALADTLTALRIERCGVYGSHTGAAIALELARRHEPRVASLIVDGLPVFLDEERRDLLAHYLPHFEPRLDGTHLLALWARYRDQHLFFPWYNRSQAARVDKDMPDARHLHEDVLDFLRAGDDYRVAYAAAFRYSPLDALEALNVPTNVIAREDDLNASQLDRLPALPSCCSVSLLPRDRQSWADRIAMMFAASPGDGDAPPIPKTTAMNEGATRRYVETSCGQILVRQASAGTTPPLMLLHDSLGSSASLLSLFGGIAKSRSAVAIDLPGHGESDEHDIAEPSINDYTRIVIEVLECLDLARVDVFGAACGALIGLDAAILYPNRVRSLILDCSAEPNVSMRALDAHVESLRPRNDGAHLIAAWRFLQDRTLFDPWYEQTRATIRSEDAADADDLHAALVELLKGGIAHTLMWWAARDFPIGDRLSQLRQRALLLTSKGREVFGMDVKRNALVLNSDRVTRLTLDSVCDQASIFERFLASETSR
jgi:pimeloyl-ACP methyl ester carboxylesterase